jgi:hypothetical protein
MEWMACVVVYGEMMDGCEWVKKRTNRFPFLVGDGPRDSERPVPCRGCLVRYQSGGSGSQRLMRRKTRGDDVASSWHSDRPPIMTHDATHAASDLQPTVYSSQSGCE